MERKPSDFFITVGDFFAIFLPGAMVAYMTRPWGNDQLQASALRRFIREAAEGWVVFLIVSYVLGNFIFAVSAILFDWHYQRLAQPLSIPYTRYWADDPAVPQGQGQLDRLCNCCCSSAERSSRCGD
jgi:hypothetical protein